MVNEDFFDCLTREIKDEVMERYVTERRLIELQLEDLEERIECVRAQAKEAATRLKRVAFWMLTDSMRKRLAEALNIPPSSVWRQHLAGGLPYEAHSIAVSAFRDRTKLRQIVIKAYGRAYQWMGRYRKGYEDLANECRAVVSNIMGFQNNSDLITVLTFLKGIDTCAMEKSRFLGGNFTAPELSSIDEKLRFRAPTVESAGLPPPLALPQPHAVEHSLSQFADMVFDQYRGDVVPLMDLWGKRGY